MVLDIKDWLALIGVITGLVGSLAALLASAISVFAYRRDGVQLKIQVRKGWKILHARPPYKEDTPYTGMTVYNRGRRATTISQVGEVYLLKSGGGIYSDSMIYGARKLETESSTDYLVEEGVRKQEVVGYYVARTTSGREFRLYLYTRLVYWVFYPSRKLYWQIEKKKSRK